jgi:exodeoxyribonuclease V gamma subunit
MFHVIPSNQLSLLVAPLSLLLALPKQHVLAPDWVLVPHRGMQHWLSMALAEKPDRLICMNIDMQLPASGFWRLVHDILGDSGADDSAHWRRESLVWRLFHLLARPDVVNDPAMDEPTRYWQGGGVSQQGLKRFQLAEQLADLFEQYLIYRPDWIRQWKTAHHSHWQSQLWQHLVDEAGDHPLDLIDKAIAQAQTPKTPLPDRIFLFAVNNLAPLWLDFLHALSDQAGLDVHLLYLNPSDEYWEDHVSERRVAQMRAKWLEEGSLESILDTGNPLLSSLGTQGQAFIRLLSDRADLETACFSAPPEAAEDRNCLQHLQHDVLVLNDRTQSPTPQIDDSIRLVSAHSALREVQALHDWLLGCFNDQPDLKPRDVVVMCPNIEAYAPFIEAVFARGYDQLSEQTPPLPCSIADRSLITADPLVHAFLSFLDLPDDRLQVSQMMAWLHVPAIQEYFGFSHDSLEKIADWLQIAHVHWGLDAAHKAQVLATEQATATYSWRLGLERLLLGFAWGDQDALVDGRLMLSAVEGDDAQVLGRLIEFVDRLERLSQQLRAERPVAGWVQLLRTDLLDAFFSTASDSRSYQVIDQSLQDWMQRVAVAGEDKPIPGNIVRYYLQQELSRPETTANQYLMGQITFCSMIPMRSVPFDIVAVLGLNDGEFPRQRQSLGFDLMAGEAMRLGDRSRRGDDRYLFLETLMSAQQKLYLSYQGHSIHNNTEQQPSLVLAELMDYLTRGFGWQFPDHTVHVPMQPFSPAAYQGSDRSFDPVWLRLADKPASAVRSLLPASGDENRANSLNDLIQFFYHPTEYWAKHQLGVYLDDRTTVLDDVEPFVSDYLLRYSTQQDMVSSLIEHQGDSAPLAAIVAQMQLSGSLPEHPLVALELDEWQQQAQDFHAVIATRCQPTVNFVDIDISVAGIQVIDAIGLTAEGNVQVWRLADPKAKDYLRLWLTQLVLQVATPNFTGQVEGWYRGKDGFSHIKVSAIADAEVVLANWLSVFAEGMREPLFLNADMGIKTLAGGSNNTPSKLWQTGHFSTGMSEDPYMAHYWHEMPSEDLFLACGQFYADMMAHCTLTQGSVA